MNAIEKLKSRGIIPRAALYARFSSDNQREESIDAQLRALHEFCKKTGAVVLAEYIDRAKSATTDDRPEFLRLISDAKNEEFDFVIVHKLDRFSRNRYDSAHYKFELKKHGVSVISVLEQLDGSPESIMLESTLEGMAEYYSRNLSREVMKGMKESALQCKALGGRPPFGYKVNKETRLYEINEEEADGVRLIFDRFDQGVGYSGIITELNEHGYRTRLGNYFAKNSLYEILKNERYTGIYIFNRAASHDINHKRNNHNSKPDDEVIRIPGGMPRIIDDDVFNRVQWILNNRRHISGTSKAIEPFLLTGRMVCGLCGKSLSGMTHYSGRNKLKHVTYSCIAKHNRGNVKCQNKDVNKKYIEDFVSKKIGEIIFDEKNIPRLIKAYAESGGEINSEIGKAIKKTATALKSVEQKIGNIVSVVAQSGSMALMEQLKALEDEKRILCQRLEEDQSKLSEKHLDSAEILVAYRKAQQLWNETSSGTLDDVVIDSQKQLLRIYLKQVIVYPEHLEIQICNIPSFLISPSETVVLDDDGSAVLHIIFGQKNNASNPNLERTRISMVEARVQKRRYPI